MSKRNFQGPASSLRFTRGRPAYQGRCRKPFFIAALLTWMIFGSALAWAQAPSSVKTPPSESESTAKESDFALNAWVAHREFLARGEWEKSREELEKIYQWKLDQGIPESLSIFHRVDERKPAAEREIRGGPRTLELCCQDGPRFFRGPAGPGGLALVPDPELVGERDSGGFGLGEGVWRSFANPEEVLPQLATLTLLIVTSFLLAFGAFAFFLFLSYSSFFAHHLKHLVRIQVSPVPVKILSIFLLFSPLVLGLGWMWTPVLWLLVFWVYARKGERKVAVVLLILLLSLPSGVRPLFLLLLSGAANGVPEMLRAGTGVWNEDLYRRVLDMNHSKPEDRDLLQALGSLRRRWGSFREAERRFEEMARVDTVAGPALNNLGNIS